MKGLRIGTLVKWIFRSITLVLISYAGVLGYISVETDRDVQFWPPKIGPEPRSIAINTLGELQSDLTEIKTILSDELVRLNSKLADARTKMADRGTIGGYDTYEWRANVRGYEKDIAETWEDLTTRIKNLEKRIIPLRRTCASLGQVSD